MTTQWTSVGAFAIIMLAAGVASAEPESYPGHRGYGSHRPCPYNCAIAHVPKDKCREWRTGNECYIEDFTRAPRNGDNPAIAKSDPPPSRDDWHYSGDTSDSNYRSCRDAGRLARPAIEMNRSKATGNFLGNKRKFRGTVEGTCLVEAGLYEHGRRVETIPVTTTRDFRRFDFDVKADPDNRPEIRVYNVNGDRDIFYLGQDDERRTDDRPYNHGRSGADEIGDAVGSILGGR